MIRQGQAIIIAAVIGLIGAIIAALIMTLKLKTIEIIIADIETKQIISGEVFIDANNDGKPSYPGNPAVIRVRRSNRFIRIESKGYQSRIIPVKNINNLHIIELEAIYCEVCKIIPPNGDLIPLSLAGWDAWGGITITGIENDNIINGQIRGTAGFNNANMSTDLRGKTLYLFFSNTNMSTFDANRMIKLTFNNNDMTLLPDNRNPIYGEYLSVENTPSNQGIKFTIPDNFDGKLGFVFFQAILRDLKITAYYK